MRKGSPSRTEPHNKSHHNRNSRRQYFYCKDGTYTMTIKYDDLIEILMKRCSWGDDASPRETLYVDFRSSTEIVQDVKDSLYIPYKGWR